MFKCTCTVLVHLTWATLVLNSCVRAALHSGPTSARPLESHSFQVLLILQTRRSTNSPELRPDQDTGPVYRYVQSRHCILPRWL